MSEGSNERVFVVVADSLPILAFRARSIGEAMELGREAWLREDLKHMTTNHVPLWDGKSPIHVRSAQPAEAAAYQRGFGAWPTDAGELPLVFLVEVDEQLEAAEATAPGAFPPRR